MSNKEYATVDLGDGISLDHEDQIFLLSSLAAVRASGAINMFDRLGVAALLDQIEVPEVAGWLRSKGMRNKYIMFLNRMAAMNFPQGGEQ